MTEQHADTESVVDPGRRVCLAMNVTLDGYVGATDGGLGWLWPTLDPAIEGSVVRFLDTVDTILVGHDTYIAQAAQWAPQSGPIADLLNAHAKVVFSSRLDKLDWNNSRLAKTDAATEIARLKQEPGKDIYVTGGATLAQSLTREGLIDEYIVIVHPVVLGGGKRLFADVPELVRFALLTSTTYESGAIELRYRRLS